MATMKYDIPLLNRNTIFLLRHLMIYVVLAQMDLNDALLGLDQKALSQILIDVRH